MARVNVITPEGKPATAPEERIPALLEMGYKLESSASAARRAVRNELRQEAGGALEVAGKEFISGAGMGLPDLLRDKDIASVEQEDRPYLSAGANILGSVLPSLASGGSGTVAKMLRFTPAALADEAAAAAARGVKGLVAAKSGARGAEAFAQGAKISEEARLAVDAANTNLADQLGALSDIAETVTPTAKKAARFGMIGKPGLGAAATDETAKVGEAKIAELLAARDDFFNVFHPTKGPRPKFPTKASDVADDVPDFAEWMAKGPKKRVSGRIISKEQAEAERLTRPGRYTPGPGAPEGIRTVPNTQISAEQVAKAFDEDPARARAAIDRLEAATTNIVVDPEIMPNAKGRTLAEIFDLPIKPSGAAADVSEAATKVRLAEEAATALRNNIAAPGKVEKALGILQPHTRSIVDGALFGAGEGVRQSALGDDPINAELLLANVTSNMLIGGGFGAAASIGGSLVGKAFSKMGTAASENLSLLGKKLDPGSEVLSHEERVIKRGAEAAQRIADGEKVTRLNSLAANRIEKLAEKQGWKFDGLDKLTVANELARELGLPDLGDIPAVGSPLETALRARSAANFLSGGKTQGFLMRALKTAGDLSQSQTARRILGSHGTMVAGLPGVAERLGKTVAANTQRISKAVDKMIDVGERVGPRAKAMAGPVTHKILNRIKFAEKPDEAKEQYSATGKPIEKTAAAFLRRADEIRGAMRDPEMTQRKISLRLSAVQGIDESLASQISAKAIARVAFLHDKLPKNTAIHRLAAEGLNAWRPSKTEIMKWSRYVQGAEDPLGYIEDVANGKFNPEGAEALRAVHPDVYYRVQQVLISRVSEMREQLPYKQRLKLSMTFGVPIDSSMRPDVLSAIQDTFTPPSGDQQQPQQGGGVPTTAMQSIKVPEPTKAQQLSGR